MLDMVRRWEANGGYLRHATEVQLLGKGLGKKCLCNQTVDILMIYSRSFRKKARDKNILYY